MAVGKVSDADFEAEVLKATGPVVVEETDATFFEPLASDTARLVKMFQALVHGNERTDADGN